MDNDAELLFKNREVQRAVAERAHDEHRNQTAQHAEAARRSGNSAVKNAILINGGALIAILTFVGNLSSKTNLKQCIVSHDDARWFGASMIVYAAGLLFGAATYCLAWQTNSKFYNAFSQAKLAYDHPYVSPSEETEKELKMGRIYARIATGFTVSSFIAFAIASLLSGATIMRIAG